jgi:hypothetical protein
MILVGQDVLTTSSAAAAGAAPVMNARAEAQVKKVLVEYQTRELQYQSELKSASGLISNANQQLSQANQ